MAKQITFRRISPSGDVYESPGKTSYRMNPNEGLKLFYPPVVTLVRNEDGSTKYKTKYGNFNSYDLASQSIPERIKNFSTKNLQPTIPASNQRTFRPVTRGNVEYFASPGDTDYEDVQGTTKRQRDIFKLQRTAAMPRLTAAQKNRRREYITAFAGQDTPEGALNFIELNPGARLSPQGFNYDEAVALGLIDTRQYNNWGNYGGGGTVAPTFAGGRGSVLPVMTAPTQGFWSKTVSGARRFGETARSGVRNIASNVASTMGKFFGGRSRSVLSPTVGGRSTLVTPGASSVPLSPSATPGIWKKFLKEAQKTWNATVSGAQKTGNVIGAVGKSAFVTAGRGVANVGKRVFDMATGTAYPVFMTEAADKAKQIYQTGKRIFRFKRSPQSQAALGLRPGPSVLGSFAPSVFFNPQGEEYNPFGIQGTLPIVPGAYSPPMISQGNQRLLNEYVPPIVPGAYISPTQQYIPPNVPGAYISPTQQYIPPNVPGAYNSPIQQYIPPNVPGVYISPTQQATLPNVPGVYISPNRSEAARKLSLERKKSKLRKLAIDAKDLVPGERAVAKAVGSLEKRLSAERKQKVEDERDYKFSLEQLNKRINDGDTFLTNFSRKLSTVKQIDRPFYQEIYDEFKPFYDTMVINYEKAKKLFKNGKTEEANILLEETIMEFNRRKRSIMMPKK